MSNFAIRYGSNPHARLRKQVERINLGSNELHVFQALPLPKNREINLPQMLELNDKTVFQTNEEGWIYVYSKGKTCLYVGQTKERVPLPRAAAHQIKKETDKESPFAAYLQKCNFQGVNLRFVLPDDCEQLIRASFLLPCEYEHSEKIMNELEKEYQLKRQQVRWWLLDRAEWVLITTLDPQFNESRIAAEAKKIRVTHPSL